MCQAGLLFSSSPMLLIHTHLTSYICSYPVFTYVVTVAILLRVRKCSS